MEIARHQFTILKQNCELIPGHLVPKLARERGLDRRSRTLNSICDLCKAIWGIEIFFQQIKQNLQITDLPGNNENAVRRQMWIALLAYLPLRFIEFIAKWKKTFFRLFTLDRGGMWSCLDLFSLLESCGTAGAKLRMRAASEQACLPGFSP